MATTHVQNMPKTKTNFFLFCAYFATCLEDRTWSFVVSLCMDSMGGMRMLSLEQFFEGILQMGLSGHLGKYFDKLTRRRAIMTVVPLNNLSVCAAAALIITCFSLDSNSSLYIPCLVVSMSLCAVNRLYLNAERFIIGRDWVMVIGGEERLANLNASLLTLDQFTNVIGPLFVGALVTWAGLRETLAFFGIASFVSMIFKAVFLRLLYYTTPELHVKHDSEIVQSHLKESVFFTYWKQSSFPAALGEALLYMTVMAFGGLAVGYGSSAGLPEFIIGAFRSFGSVTAILGSFSYAFFEKRYGVLTSGIIGLLVQQVFAVMAVSSVFLPGSPKNLGGYFGNFTTGTWWHAMVHSFDKKNTTGYDPQVDWSSFSADGVSLASIMVFLVAIASARYGRGNGPDFILPEKTFHDSGAWTSPPLTSCS